MYQEGVLGGCTGRMYQEGVLGGCTGRMYQEGVLGGCTGRMYQEGVPGGCTGRVYWEGGKVYVGPTGQSITYTFELPLILPTLQFVGLSGGGRLAMTTVNECMYTCVISPTYSMWSISNLLFSSSAFNLSTS